MLVSTEAPEHEPDILLDFSMLNKYMSCPRAFYHSHVEHIVPSTRDQRNLLYGGAIHEALDYFYSEIKEGRDPILDDMCAVFMDYALRDPGDSLPISTDVDPATSFERGLDLLEGYFKVYFSDRYLLKVKHVEIPFYVVVSPRIGFIGRMDGVIEQMGRTYILEHKTTSSLSNAYFSGWRPHHQLSGYMYAYEKIMGERPAGVLLNAMLKKEVKSRSLGDHFRREPITRTKGELDEFEAQFVHLAERIADDLSQVESGSDPDVMFWQNTGSCWKWFRPCAYLALCEVDPRWRAGIRDKHYKTYKWDPHK